MHEWRSIAFLLIFIVLILVGVGCRPNTPVNYIGKKRTEIIELCDKYEKYDPPNGGIPKIMIGFNSGYRYYSNITEALSDDNLLKASSISINFSYGKQGLKRGLYFYKIYFDQDGVAIDQKYSFMAK